MADMTGIHLTSSSPFLLGHPEDYIFQTYCNYLRAMKLVPGNKMRLGVTFELTKWKDLLKLSSLSLYSCRRSCVETVEPQDKSSLVGWLTYMTAAWGSPGQARSLQEQEETFTVLSVVDFAFCLPQNKSSLFWLL